MDHSTANPALSAATDILADPSLKTAFVGARSPVWRRLSTMVLAFALSTGAPIIAIDLAERASAIDEIAARVKGPETIDAAPVQPHPPLPLHPLLRAGQGPDGRLNVSQLFSAWSNAGLSEHNAKIMLVALYGAGPMFNAVDRSRPDPEGFGRISDNQATELFVALGADPARAVPGKHHGWSEIYDTWKALIDDEEFDEHLYDAVQGATPEQAHAEVKLAMQEAGLASLALPLSTQANPGRMMAYATAIRQINHDLGETTGWGGQALGLAGRVHLSLTPPSAGLDGATWQENGKVMIGTKWGATTHEWLHGVDLVLGSHAFANPSRRSASEQLGVLRIKSANGSAHAHKQLLMGLEKAAPEWSRTIKQLDEHMDREYFSSSTEVLSRSFESHMLHARDGKQALGISSQVDNPSYPNQSQAIEQARLWSSWFSSIKTLQLTTPVAPTPRAYDDFGQMLAEHRQGNAIRTAAKAQGIASIDPDPPTRSPSAPR